MWTQVPVTPPSGHGEFRFSFMYYPKRNPAVAFIYPKYC